MMVGFKEALHRRRYNYKKVPRFLRQEYHRYKDLQGAKWRRPRGLHSKLRLQRDGRNIVKVGYGTDKRVRGRLQNGKLPILVLNPTTDINRNWGKYECAVISKQFNSRNRITIKQKLQDLGVEVVN